MMTTRGAAVLAAICAACLILFPPGVHAGSNAPPLLPPSVVRTAPTSSLTQCQSKGTGCARYILDLMNTARASYGTAPLHIDWRQTHGVGACIGSSGHARHLAQVVQSYADFGTYAHDQFAADVCGPGIAGEAVGLAGGDKASSSLQTLQGMLSEPHDTTGSCLSNHACLILARAFSRVGIAFSQNSLGWYLVMDFIA